MKRVVVAPHDPAEFLGGTERVVEAMVRVRRQRGEEIVVFAGSERYAKGGRIDVRAETGLAVHRVLRDPSETGEIFLRPRIRGELERLLSAIDPDLVEWHHGATLSLDLARAAREMGVPVLMFVHDLWLSCPRFFRIPPLGVSCPEREDRGACAGCVGRDLPWPPEPLADWVSRFTESAREELKAANARIAPSAAHAARFQTFFPDLDLGIHAVGHGLLDADLPRRPAPPAARPGSLRIAHFGNLVPEKGLHDLAAALAQVAEPRRVSLDLYGEELAPGLVAGARELCPNAVITHHGGYPHFSAILEKVGSADLAVFPSRAHESYGLVVEEAFAAGLPVLVSNRGALPERVRQAGEVLPAEDPGAWAAAIERLLEHPDALAALRARVPAERRTIENAIDEVDEIMAGVS